MNNKQMPGARKAQRIYPDATFRVVTDGIEVNGTLVLVPATMTPEELFRAIVAVIHGT
jgi:hypothetical protein